MTLSQRLEQAKKERLIASGALHSEAALKPVDETGRAVTTGDTDTFGGIVIEVSSSGIATPAAPAGTDGTSMLQSTTSKLCPTCQKPGTIDLVDLVGHTMHLTCPHCRTMWQVRETES